MIRDEARTFGRLTYDVRSGSLDPYSNRVHTVSRIHRKSYLHLVRA